MFNELFRQFARLLGRDLPLDTYISRRGADGRDRLSQSEIATLFQSDLRHETVRFRKRSERRRVENGNASFDDNVPFLLVTTASSPLKAAVIS
ncbi:MAG: hypothetical protein HUJ27_15450 [Rhodobacteraceae bacterium]|nr:hypothetical protein [Paracoccaceae bacterium]